MINLIPSKLILTLLGYALAAAGVMGSMYAGYNHIKHTGYLEAEAKYEQKFKDYEKVRDEKLTSIGILSGILVADSKANQESTEKAMKAILAATKNKPLVVVKDGGCTPSQTFSDSISEINKRVNQSMKDSQK